MEHESDIDTNCNWRARNSHQKIGKGTGGRGNKRPSRDHPNYNISLNTKKNPGDLGGLAVT